MSESTFLFFVPTSVSINLTELAGVPLISPSPDTPGGAAIIDAFRAAGISMPPVAITTFSVHLRNILSMRGRFIAVLPNSVLWFGPAGTSLKELPVDLPLPEWPALIVTLKNRTLRPAVQRFLACLREAAGSRSLIKLGRTGVTAGA